jgi:hypothetical protein
MHVLEPFRARDIPARGLEDYRAALRGHEGKLVAAKRQRDVIQIDMKKTTIAVDLGDQRARAELHNLHKSDDAIARLVASLEGQIAEARKRVLMAEAQGEVVASKKASLDGAAVPRDKWFLVACPDGREVRHCHHSIEALRKELQQGYTIKGEIFGSNDAGEGGVVAAIAPAGPSIMAGLLAAHGPDLLAWLEAQGFQREGGSNG